jgi:hypothetical protein
VTRSVGTRGSGSGAPAVAEVDPVASAALATHKTSGDHDALYEPNGAVAALAPSIAEKLVAANNLSDLASAATARTNLGLGTAATHAATDFDPAGAATAAAAGLVNAAPGTLDTLKELADALGDDPNYATTITAALAGKLNVVVHGATAGTARPVAAPVVLWVGTVAPTNAATNDLWWDKTAVLLKLWTSAAWTASGSASYVGTGGVKIDLCQAPYNATPGTDVTTALQTALNWIATNCLHGGEIYFSQPGVYNINGATQTGTAQGYTYNGQVLIPAVSLANSMPIVIRGGIRSSGGGQTTGAPNGVVLLSNATAGYVVDIIPSFTEFGCPWTGVMPIFEDIVFRNAADDPTAGGLNLLCTQRAKLERVQIDTPNSFVPPVTGTLEALVMPQIYNNGDVTVRDVTIRGYPVGMRLSEHNVLDNVDIAYCRTAFKGGGAAHANWFGYTDVEECPTVFAGGGTPAFGSPAPSAGTVVYGFMDWENGATNALAAAAFVNDNTLTNPVKGQISLYNTQSGSQPIVGGQSLDVVPLKVTPSIGPQMRGIGWHGTHPYDNFNRVINLSGTGSPGQCFPSLHPWRVESGGFTVSGNKLQPTANPSACYVPCIKAAQNYGVSRTVTATITLGATTPLVRLYALCGVNASGTSQDGGTTGIEVKLTGGSQALLRAYNTNIAGGGSNLVAGSTYTVKLAVYHDATGWPESMKVYINGTLTISAGLPAALKTLGGNSSTYPYYEDGIAFNDTGSSCSLFAVQEITQDPPFIETGTATLAAGTVTVSNSRITASSIIRYWRTTAGGTLGELAISLSAGSGFTITSNSGTDTSGIRYEIVSY